MKMMTILGTRPEIIRLSQIIAKLDRASAAHVLVHTGQNYDRALSDVFFEQMRIRPPDVHIRLADHAFGRQIGQMFGEVEACIAREKPDRVLVLGDTNSALCAIVAERAGVPVYHMEAGNRCYDRSVPEELNRRLIDAIATYNLPYTPQARENLLREGMPPHRVWVSGNPIREVMRAYADDIARSDAPARFGVEQGGYFVVTAHRAENVDRPDRLRQIVEGLRLVAERERLPIICSIHPRTRERLRQLRIETVHPLIRFLEPLGFFDFIRLQQDARCVITDSGTVQEESCLLGVPAVTIRQTTERPETVLCGSNTVAGLDPERIAACVALMAGRRGGWALPEGYADTDVSDKVVQYLLGGLHHV